MHEAGGSTTVAVPPGVALRPYVSAGCEYKPQGQTKVSAAGDALDEPFVVPPVLEQPTVTQSLNANTVKYLSPSRLPRGKRVYVDVSALSDMVDPERMKARFQGSGINVTRSFTQAQLLNGEAYVALKPSKRGIIRHWVTMQPYGAQSQVQTLRVR